MVGGESTLATEFPEKRFSLFGLTCSSCPPTTTYGGLSNEGPPVCLCYLNRGMGRGDGILKEGSVWCWKYGECILGGPLAKTIHTMQHYIR